MDGPAALTQIRNYLAGQLVGGTSDDVLLHEVLKLLVAVRAFDHSEPPAYQELVATWPQVRKSYPELFEAGEGVDITEVDYASIVDLLFHVLADPASDPFGDLFEVFASEIAKGAHGQFFTPPAAIDFLVAATDPRPGESVMDPACGAAGFLAATVEHLMRAGASPELAATSVTGIEKDRYLAAMATARLKVATGHESRVLCGDSLALSGPGVKELLERQFDVVLANPPFGSKIVAATEQIARQFALAHAHKLGTNGVWRSEARLQKNPSPQVLFVERILSLVRPGGRAGIVLPESLVSSKTHSYVVQFILERAELKAVIGMPESLFKVTGKSGTHTKTVLLVLEKPEQGPPSSTDRIYMAEVQQVGKDSRGRRNARSQLPKVLAEYSKGSPRGRASASSQGNWITPTDLERMSLAPRNYDPRVVIALAALRKTHSLVRFGDLVNSGLVQVRTGHEVGANAYGTGSIPFVRTSDISNWEIKSDPKHLISDELYAAYGPRQDVRPGDILMVRDGTYLIGACALITEFDQRIVYQSHILKFRVTNPEELSPHLLLAALGSDPVLLQIRAKRTTQDIIDTLGDRYMDLVLPIPKNREQRDQVVEMVRTSIAERIEAREMARKARALVVSHDLP